MADLPLVVQLLESTKEDENSYVFRLGMSDGQAYFVRFMATAADQLAEALQGHRPTPRPSQTASLLRVHRASTRALPDGQPALQLETDELGPVLIPLGLEGLDELLRQLGELRTKLQSSTTRH